MFCSRRLRFFKKTVKGLIRADHAHIGARPFLNSHQSALQIFDLGRQRTVALGQFGVFLGLRLNADAQGMGLAHTVFVNPEQVMEKHQRGDQRRSQKLQFQSLLGGMDHGARGGETNQRLPVVPSRIGRDDGKARLRLKRRA